MEMTYYKNKINPNLRTSVPDELLELDCMNTDTHFGFSYVIWVNFCILSCLLYCHCCLNTTDGSIKRAFRTGLQMFLHGLADQDC